MSKIKNILKKITNDKYFIILNFIVIIICSIIYFKYISLDKTYLLMDVGADNINYHLPVYQYIIEKIKTGTELPFWSFNMGIGTSTLTIQNFIFDPFNIILLLFSVKDIYYGFVFVVIFKIYFSTIIFYGYLEKINIKGKSALIGAIMWGFSGYMILWCQHYVFGTAIVFFTLIMYSFERYIKENKAIMFIISIALLAINSEYMLYAVSIYIYIYMVLRYTYTYGKDIKKIIKKIMQVSLLYMLGIGISAVVFIPSAYVILSSPRLSSTVDFSIFSTWGFNKLVSIFIRVFSANLLGINDYAGPALDYYEAMILSSSVLVVLLIPQLFIIVRNDKRKKFILVCSSLMIILGILFPLVSYLFNAFAAISTRWTYVITFTLVLGASISIDFIIKNRTINIKLLIYQCILSIMLLGLGIIYLFKYTGNISNFVLLKKSLLLYIMISLIMVLFVFMLYKYKKSKVSINIVIVILVFEIISNNYATVNSRLVLENSFIKSKTGYNDNTYDVVEYLKKIDKNLFYRIEKNYSSVFLNDAMYQNYYGTACYNSLNSPSYTEFLKEFNSLSFAENFLYPLLEREKLDNFLGVKYILSLNEISRDDTEYLGKYNDINIYLNKKALPLGFTYDSYITRQEFDKLDISSKEDAILNNIILDDKVKYMKKGKIPQYKNISSFIYDYKNVDVIDNNKSYIEYKVVNDDPNVNILLGNEERNGITLTLNIDSEQIGVGQVFYKDSNSDFSEDKSIKFNVFPNKKEYNVFINYKDIDKLRIDVGNYNEKIKLSNIKVRKDENEDFLNNKNVFEITSFKEDKIKGTIQSRKKEIINWTIPFDNGWRIKVDGKKVKPLKVNIGFLGAELDEGKHEIELKYIPPGLILGSFISLIFIVITFIFRKRF